jgi:hypothetical protein
VLKLLQPVWICRVTLWSWGPLGPLRSWLASFALRAGGAVRTRISLLTLWSCEALRSLKTRISLFSLLALGTSGSRHTGGFFQRCKAFADFGKLSGKRLHFTWRGLLGAGFLY